MRSRLFAAWLLATTVAVALAYSAVGLVQTQVTERGVVLAVVDVTSPTLGPEDIPPVPSSVTVPDEVEDRVDAAPGAADVDTDSEIPSNSTLADDESTTTVATTPSTSTPTTSPNTTSTSTTTTTTTIPGPETSELVIPTDGGTVKVSCTDDVIALQSALPKSGFTKDVKSEGPQEVRVTFEDADDHEFDIRAACTAGEVDYNVSDGD